MRQTIIIPTIGNFDYSLRAKVYATFITIPNIGALTFTIGCEGEGGIVDCVPHINQIFSNTAALDMRARKYITEDPSGWDGASKSFRLASIDYHLNRKFDFFYVNTEGAPEWVIVRFSSDMEPLQIEFDL